jgi:hypothetical protein
MNEGPLKKTADAPLIDLAKPAPPVRSPVPAPPAPAAPAPAPPRSRARPTQAGPAWIVIPARVIAVVIVLPVRLVYDLLAAACRGLMRTPRWLGRALRATYMAVLHPILRPIGLGIAWLWTRTVYWPLRWLAVTVLLGGLRALGRGASWCWSALLAPAFAALGTGLHFLLVRPFRALCRGGLWLLNILVAIPAVAVWGALVWTVKGLGSVLAFLGNVLIVIPAVALWRYVLRPPLAGLAWLARKAGTGIVAGWAIFAGALVWAWRMLGRLFSMLGRVLFVIGRPVDRLDVAHVRGRAVPRGQEHRPPPRREGHPRCLAGHGRLDAPERPGPDPPGRPGRPPAGPPRLPRLTAWNARAAVPGSGTAAR